ncbi:MAG: cupin domain-containing protein [Pseudomonadota bacterium]
MSTQLWDLLVGPGMRSAPAVLEGAAFIFVRSGDGEISLDGKEQALRMGMSLSVPEGVEVSLTNPAKDKPLAAHAVIVTDGQQ